MIDGNLATRNAEISSLEIRKSQTDDEATAARQVPIAFAATAFDLSEVLQEAETHPRSTSRGLVRRENALVFSQAGGQANLPAVRFGGRFSTHDRAAHMHANTRAHTRNPVEFDLELRAANRYTPLPFANKARPAACFRHAQIAPEIARQCRGTNGTSEQTCRRISDPAGRSPAEQMGSIVVQRRVYTGIKLGNTEGCLNCLP